MVTSMNWNLPQIKADLQRGSRESGLRGLYHSSKWFAELAFSLEGVKAAYNEQIKERDASPDVDDRLVLAKSYFDLKEYDRSAYFAKGCPCSRGQFIYYYSRYLAGEKKKDDDIVESPDAPDSVKNDSLRELRTDLQKKYNAKLLDGFGIYLYGVVLKKLDLKKLSLDALVEAVRVDPLNWSAWIELINLIQDKSSLNSLDLPNHWMKQFFLAHVYLELQLNDDALAIYDELQKLGFATSSYILAQIAIAFHNQREVDQAVSTFQSLQKIDPYCLDHMDTYSNLLYVKEMRMELSYLAHHTNDVDKYRVETCCVIGNYYSLRNQHEKAVVYFQRALKLNPNYLSAWTLMGHEYMEMKNTNAAIQAYRQAIEVNRRDYRAWYGLGQTYEILKMNFYCLYYYRQAQQLRPNDSRMLVALGESYEKLDKLEEAKKCFWKAHCVGDIEGMALSKLAKLFVKLNEEVQAAGAYRDYIREAELQGIKDREELFAAYKFMANYHLRQEEIEDAYKYAQKCTEYNETKEEGKSLIRQIAALRTPLDVTMDHVRNMGEDEALRSITTVISGSVGGANGTNPSLSRISPLNLFTQS